MGVYHHHRHPDGKGKSSKNEKFAASTPENGIADPSSSLPIVAYREEIISALKDDANDTLILVGETGSGKSTQIPKFIYFDYLLKDKKKQHELIGITQPRRIAAITLARRVSVEMATKLGQEVGYSVRFDEMSTANVTRIKYLTDGMLLREYLIDPELKKFGVLCLDEVHERSLRTDILFGLLKTLQENRRQKGNRLKLVIMSATMEIEKYKSFFNGHCRLLQVEGRQFPVRIFYTPTPQKDYIEAAALTVLQIHMETPCTMVSGSHPDGATVPDATDILVFLSGQEEIDSLQVTLLKNYEIMSKEEVDRDSTKKKYGKLLVLPIYAALSPEQQLLVFSRFPPGISSQVKKEGFPGFRRVILATNIAETSITIPGIRYVIDSGVMKERHYHPSLSLESLLVIPISKAAARQRTGRAGRECPGYCYRLYTEETFGTLQNASVPEILRSNLAFILLLLKSCKVENILSFPFLDSPSIDSMKQALITLYELAALDKQGNLTELGRKMALFPLDPKLSAMILVAEKSGATEEIITIVSLLSVENLFVHVRVHQDTEEESTSLESNNPSTNFSNFMDPSGDHMTLLRIYAAYKESKNPNLFLSTSPWLSKRAWKEALRIREQLVRYCKSSNIRLVSCGCQEDIILRVLLSSYRSALSNIALLAPSGGTYTLISTTKNASNPTKNDKFGKSLKIHPISVFFAANRKSDTKLPEIVLFHELVFTSQAYMKCVSSVPPAWLVTSTAVSS